MAVAIVYASYGQNKKKTKANIIHGLPWSTSTLLEYVSNRKRSGYIRLDEIEPSNV